MSVNCTSLGKRISFYRSKSNLSQEALAAKINCSREHIVRIENGTKIPSISVLVEIANTLSVSADELLLDCLEHSSSSANSEFHRLLLDCNETEQTVIIRMQEIAWLMFSHMTCDGSPPLLKNAAIWFRLFPMAANSRVMASISSGWT